LRDVLTLILAGGKGTRLEPLTRDRAKPAVPFGGLYRIIDFPLSNCLNSNLRKILVLTQYKARSLDRHLNLGWNFLSPQLDEYVEVLPPQQRIDEHWYKGTADAIYQNIYVIEKANPKYIVILAADHIYKMDYSEMIRLHIERGSDLTIGCIPVPVNEANQFGVLSKNLSIHPKSSVIPVSLSPRWASMFLPQHHCLNYSLKMPPVKTAPTTSAKISSPASSPGLMSMPSAFRIKTKSLFLIGAMLVLLMPTTKPTWISLGSTRCLIFTIPNGPSGLSSPSFHLQNSSLTTKACEAKAAGVKPMTASSAREASSVVAVYHAAFFPRECESIVTPWSKIASSLKVSMLADIPESAGPSSTRMCNFPQVQPLATISRKTVNADSPFQKTALS
jgi:hypothetical protein